MSWWTSEDGNDPPCLTARNDVDISVLRRNTSSFPLLKFGLDSVMPFRCKRRDGQAAWCHLLHRASAGLPLFSSASSPAHTQPSSVPHVHCPSILPLTARCSFLKSQSHVFHSPSPPSTWHSTTQVWRKRHAIFLKCRLRKTQYEKQIRKQCILKYSTDNVYFIRSILETMKVRDYHRIGIS